MQSRARRCSALLALLASSLVAAVGPENEASCGGDACLDEVRGALGDCSCSVDTIDYFNNVKIFPRIHSLVAKDYFRFYKTNLKKECPFWVNDGACAMRYCHIEPCSRESVPAYPSDRGDYVDRFEDPEYKYSQKAQGDCGEYDSELSYLNMTISAESKGEIAKWKAYDDALDNFCESDNGDAEAEYVDLSLNPERFTGYRGPSAHRIWRSIYEENCFRSRRSPYDSFPYVVHTDLKNLCLEKRVFHRAVSGLHSSINIHLCSKYLLSEKPGTGAAFTPGFAAPPEGVWGHNLVEFQRRFDPSRTFGEGPNWLKNLYFVYLLELRALAKAGPLLEREEYYTGNEVEDRETRHAIRNMLSVIYSFPDHFNESSMFAGGTEAAELKSEFREHFRNISRIMDCVGCDKCKLWGKLQVQGLGTALKILFSGRFDSVAEVGGSLSVRHRTRLNLERMEIVALFNAFAKLSDSIKELENFRNMLREASGKPQQLRSHDDATHPSLTPRKNKPEECSGSTKPAIWN